MGYEAPHNPFFLKNICSIIDILPINVYVYLSKFIKIDYNSLTI